MARSSVSLPRPKRTLNLGLLVAGALILSSMGWVSCKGADTPSPGSGHGGMAGATNTTGSGGVNALGGQGGIGGQGGNGGGAGNGGAGGGASEGDCHTNADCAAGGVCFVEALLGPLGCNSGPAGRCVPYQASTCSQDSFAPDACDCLAPSFASACADLGIQAPPFDSTGLTCGGRAGRASDYTASDSCFSCVFAGCEIDGVTHPVTTTVFDIDGFPCGDGCNTCWCTPQGITTTLVACNLGGNSGSAGAGGRGGDSGGGAAGQSAGGAAGQGGG